MLPPLIQRVPCSSGERGVTMPLVALSLVAILSFAALSIDLGSLYEAKAEAQRAADAAALTAAQVISTESVTGDPISGGTDGNWAQICGGPNSFASLAATNVAQQNLIGGAPATQVNTYYGTSAGGVTNTDCISAGTGFGINPVVSVYVQQASLPNFFSRIFSFISNGTASNSGVSATAYAEAFNPSDSNGGNVIPVQPRCAKPWIVPNLDPLHTLGCNSAPPGCSNFVDPGTGSIVKPGVYLQNPVLGVIGERFWLVPDCVQSGSPPQCTLRSPTPQANYPYDGFSPPAGAANLEYLPGQTSFAATAVPADGTAACSAASSPGYAQSIAGCDQTTVYACGQTSQPAVINLVENPGISDTANGVECLTHQSGADTTQLNGQDALLPTGTPTGAIPPYYPFEIQPGTSNPLIGAGVTAGVVTSSNSIVSVPIYDTGNTITQSGPNNVTIVGFLQVFVNVVDQYGDVYVTVMNVSGCGNGVGATTHPLTGTSPVPVRLIAPPVPSS